jgi:hypothetical protein
MTTETIKGTTERMAGLLRVWETARDDRRIFLDCYSRMTRNMIQAIDDGRFEDSVWVSGLLNHFADYYFKALDAYERSEPTTPAVWRQAFVATTVPGTTPIQHLLLGVNAHINFDLVFAVGDVLEPQCLRESRALGEIRYRDHCLVNNIIGETVDEVQDDVIERHSPTLDLLDKLGGPLDERLTSWLIAGWREEVWEAATNLLTTGSDEEAAELKRRIEARALERARLLLLF